MPPSGGRSRRLGVVHFDPGLQRRLIPGAQMDIGSYACSERDGSTNEVRHLRLEAVQPISQDWTDNSRQTRCALSHTEGRTLFIWGREKRDEPERWRAINA